MIGCSANPREEALREADEAAAAATSSASGHSADCENTADVACGCGYTGPQVKTVYHCEGATRIWMRQHQSPDGAWRAAGCRSQCRELSGCTGLGANDDDTVGLTGLVLLAMQGTGDTLRRGKCREAIKRGAKYLKSVQQPTGRIGEDERTGDLHNHTIALLALADTYALSGLTPSLKRPVAKATEWLLGHQREDGSFAPPGTPGGDAGATIWALLALDSDEATRLEIRERAARRALAWLDRVTTPGTGVILGGDRVDGGRDARPAGWTMSRDAIQAGALIARLRWGEAPRGSRMLRDARALLGRRTDRSGQSIDYLFWWFATAVFRFVGGDLQARWMKPVSSTLADTQHAPGTDAGCVCWSWDPSISATDRGFGRVYSTAVATLGLEVYYRYRKGLTRSLREVRR